MVFVRIKNYVGFSGRARRKEYWMFTLINAIVGAIINVIQLILGLELPYLSMLYLLATFLPVLALAIRRLHDTDRSGAWALLFLFRLLAGSCFWFFLHRRYFWQQSLRKRSEVWFKLILELGRYFAPFINNNKYYFPLKSLGISRRHQDFASPILSRRQAIIISISLVDSGLTTRNRPSAISFRP